MSDTRHTVGGSALRRRAISIPGVVAALTVAVLTAPLWLLGTLLVDVITGPRRLRWTRLGLLATWCLGVELTGTVLSGLVWLGAGFGLGSRTGAYFRANHRLQCFYIGALLAGARTLVGLRLQIEPGSAPVAGNAVVFGRHTSIGDAAIPAAIFGNEADLNTRYVLARGLMWGPCFDIVGHRLTNHFVARGGDTASEAAAVRALTGDFGPHTVAVLFPEGQFFSPERKARAIERLRNGSRPELAERAERLEHLLPPRPAGALALLGGAPDADVVILGHVGLERFTSMAAIMRLVPLRTPVRVWMWRIPRAEVPMDDDARIDWLYEQWARLDRTVGEHQGQR